MFWRIAAPHLLFFHLQASHSSSRSLRQVLRSTCSQESFSPPSRHTYSTPLGKTPSPPQPLSISSIKSEHHLTSTSSSSRSHCAKVRKEHTNHVVWKDYVEKVVEEQQVEVVEEKYVEYWGVSHVPPSLEVSPESHRQTFTHNTATTETFKGIKGGHLPPCEVEASPVRRQTFVTAPSRETFQEVNENVLPTCLSPDTLLRRQTFLTNPPEVFSPVVGRRFPLCDVQESPLRRQTYIKDQPHSPVTEHHPPSTHLSSIALQLPSPEHGASHTLSQLLEEVSLENTPATPALRPRRGSVEAMMASCRNLLERLNNSDFQHTPPVTPSMGETGPGVDGRDDMFTSPEEEMCTAPSTPLSEYESAPSTPPPVSMDNFNVTQEFPTPNIGGAGRGPEPGFMDSLEATLSPHPSPCRLSSGTITKETPTLHPAELITVDALPALITPPRDSTHPLVTSPDSPYHSEALSELLLYKGSNSSSCSTSGGEIFSPNRGDLTLEAFAFSPSYDPRRCSTGVKEVPPEELRHLSDKGRQLFFGSEFEGERGGVAPPASLTTSSLLLEGVGQQGLSTIEEEEIGGTFTISRTFDGQKHCLNLTPQLSPLNETHDLPTLTTLMPSEEPHPPTKETHSPVSIEKLHSPTFIIPSENSHSSIPTEESLIITMPQVGLHPPTLTEATNTQSHSASLDIPKETPSHPCTASPLPGTSEGVKKKTESPLQCSSKSAESGQDGETKTGLVFIKISPGGCKRPPEGQTKDPWAKRSRIVPTPAPASAPVPPLKRAGTKRPAVLTSRRFITKTSATVGGGGVERKARAAPQPAGVCLCVTVGVRKVRHW